MNESQPPAPPGYRYDEGILVYGSEDFVYWGSAGNEFAETGFAGQQGGKTGVGDGDGNKSNGGGGGSSIGASIAVAFSSEYLANLAIGEMVLTGVGTALTTVAALIAMPLTMKGHDQVKPKKNTPVSEMHGGHEKSGGNNNKNKQLRDALVLMGYKTTMENFDDIRGVAHFWITGKGLENTKAIVRYLRDNGFEQFYKKR
ncbi:MAG: hypothetical protein HYV28_19745 [Ignavibacteriales bacterium]|nr:hypothetical protein [Ignavibacteriales bacterium]